MQGCLEIQLVQWPLSTPIIIKLTLSNRILSCRCSKPCLFILAGWLEVEVDTLSFFFFLLAGGGEVVGCGGEAGVGSAATPTLLATTPTGWVSVDGLFLVLCRIISALLLRFC
jgi:hypothetical protein